MKLISVLCVVLLMVLSGLSWTACYWLGYSETQIALKSTEPLLPLFIEVVLFLILLSMFFRSMQLKKDRLWTICGIIAYITLFFIPWKVLPSHGSLIVYGLRDRMIRDYGLADLRSFARDTSEVLHDVYVDHGDTMSLSADQMAAYDKLKQKYPFLNWTGDGSRGPSVYGRDGAMNTDWGGPFGHWGFSIAVNGGQNEAPADPEYFVVRVSDDIYFYMD